MYSPVVAVLCLFSVLVSALPSPDLVVRQAASSIPSPTAPAAFVMPGTTIQVFPIGLGIFGGITTVAVFFVLFVTWERVQYRKTFRVQRMAESNLMRFGGLMPKGPTY